MKLLVTVKRVIDYNVQIRVKADGSGVEKDNVKMSMNPPDENAVEEALRIKEAGKADEIIILTIGNDKAQETIRTALAMGADDLEKKLERLIAEQERLGGVNLLAEQESKDLEEKVNTIKKDQSDLLSAIAKLREAIDSLNTEGRQRLLAAYGIVNENFQKLFTRLFGGGKAYLKFTDESDPLQAGLEIFASPPGKKLQNLNLLSGGEQALTALSLLFAVFLSNPAPICVLDEVDAPLDDTNVDRFCSLVEEIAKTSSTKFLVITHHRMTMARVNRLFGVTMPEKGVSQLVSVDLEKAIEIKEQDTTNEL